MTTIAVIGATGTVGSRVAAHLECRDITVVKITRSHGVDLVSGRGLAEALDGVDVVIDASNPVPSNGDGLTETFTTAYRNLVGACAYRQVQRLVVLTSAAIDDPAFDEFPYYVVKRRAKEIVLDGPVPTTIVRSTQWHEFAIDSAAVSCAHGEVMVEDWLIQPIAVDTVADVLIEAALGQTRTPRTITGPQEIRLPDLTAKILALQGDSRPVRAVTPPLAALGAGALLAPDHAMILGPDVDAWLNAHAMNGAGDHASEQPDHGGSDA